MNLWKLIAVVAASCIVLLLIIYYVYNINVQKTGALFKGAYAVYNASLSLGFMSQNISLRATIVDFNSTHVLVRVETTTISTIYFTFTGNPETRENKTIEEQWFPRSLYDTLAYRGEEEEYIQYLNRTIKCDVYVNSTDVIDLVYYVDKETKWPAKILITAKQVSIQVPLELVDTNIYKK